MDSCLSLGGPVLCAMGALVSFIALFILTTLVIRRQGWLLWGRLTGARGKWRKGKSIIYYGILLENGAMLVHAMVLGKPSAILHLLKDFAQFLLFTFLFYYFSQHTFQIMGDSRLAKWVIWAVAVLNVVYLSVFTSYVAYGMDDRNTEVYCKSDA